MSNRRAELEILVPATGAFIHATSSGKAAGARCPTVRCWRARPRSNASPGSIASWRRANTWPVRATRSPTLPCNAVWSSPRTRTAGPGEVHQPAALVRRRQRAADGAGLATFRRKILNSG
jgi:hypothetical protein